VAAAGEELITPRHYRSGPSSQCTLLSFAEMNDNQQSSALTPNPLSRRAGEGSIVTEMVVNHFRKPQ